MKCELMEDCPNEAVVLLTCANSAPPMLNTPTCQEALGEDIIAEEIAAGNITVVPIGEVL